MVGIIVVTRAALLIARRNSTWTIDAHLGGLSPECVAVELRSPAKLYCGTARHGLFRSRDSGRNWEPVGPGIDHPMITAVDVGHAGQADGFGIVYAGTEPSAVFRSDNGGDSWVDLAGLRAFPSANTWSFPPRPHTHHVPVDQSRRERRGSRVRRDSKLARSWARSTAGGSGVIAFAAVRTTRTRR